MTCNVWYRTLGRQSLVQIGLYGIDGIGIFDDVKGLGVGQRKAARDECHGLVGRDVDVREEGWVLGDV